jgi:hypothetical protein
MQQTVAGGLLLSQVSENDVQVLVYLNVVSVLEQWRILPNRNR